jgi:hypothetical protein
VLSGDWTLATLPQPISGFERRLRDLVVSHPGWDLRIDRAPGQRRRDPAVARLGTAVAGRWRFLHSTGRFSNVSRQSASMSSRSRRHQSLAWLLALGQRSLVAVRHLLAMVALLGQLILDLGLSVRAPAVTFRGASFPPTSTRVELRPCR